MVLHRCPNCGKLFVNTAGAGNNDIVHICNSGNAALDNEDVLELRNPDWNWQGVTNNAEVVAKVEGANIDDFSSRGNRKATHFIRQHEEFIKLDKNKII